MARVVLHRSESRAMIHDRPHADPIPSAAGPSGVLVTAVRRFITHRGDTLGSAIAFQTLLALTPLFLVAVACLGLWLDEGDARNETLRAVTRVVGSRGRAVFADWIDAAAEHAQSATILGVTLFVVGGSRLVVELDVAFDVVFEMPDRPPEGHVPFATMVRSFLVDRIRAIALSIGLGVLVASTIGLEAAAEAFGETNSAMAAALPVLRGVVTPCLSAIAFAALYRWLPPVTLGWRDALVGGVVTSLHFELGVAVLARSLTALDVGAGYGAAGGLFGVLLWFWYAAQAVVFGAEITAELAHRRVVAARARPRVSSGAPEPDAGSRPR